MDRDTIQRDLIRILENFTSDWDTGYEGGIQPETRLFADLAFESVDVVQLLVAIEEQYHRRDLPWVDLVMHDGRYKEEMQVADIVGFLEKSLSK